ncbi:MAG: DinB family protein [Gemmatimonadota bacterium]
MAHTAKEELRTLIRRVRDLAGGLDPETFNRRPAESSWSAGECIEHLNDTARTYLPVLSDAIRDAREEGLSGQGGDGRTWLGRLVAWSMEPPPKRFSRMKTFPELEPAADLDPAVTVDAFAELHEALIARLDEAAVLDLKRVKVRSVLDRRLKLSLGDWFAFLAAHGRRHLWQAERALETVRGG